MNKFFAREFGELAARIEAALNGKNQEEISGLLKEFLRLFPHSLGFFPEEISRSIRLSKLIKTLEFASNNEDIREVVLDGLKASRLQLLTPQEMREWKNSEERKSLLAYVSQSTGETEVYAPRDPLNDGDRALVIALRKALGRLKNSSKEE
jgi:hypothetical protein